MAGALAARIGTAAVLIAGLLAALFLLPAAWLAAVIGLIVALAAYEWAKLCRFGRNGAFAYAALTGGCVAALAWSGPAAKAALVIGAAFWIAVVPLWLWRGVRPGHAPLLVAAGLAVLIPAGAAMTLLAPWQVLLSLALTWVADTAAYFTGRSFGRHKLAPTISPGKTWEGALGAVLGCAAYAIICAFLVPSLKGLAGGAWAAYAAVVLLLCAASIIGDLFESAAKRQAAVKDSGSLLPGHGGILDRIDSATSVLPLAAIAWPFAGMSA